MNTLRYGTMNDADAERQEYINKWANEQTCLFPETLDEQIDKAMENTLAGQGKQLCDAIRNLLKEVGFYRLMDCIERLLGKVMS